VTHSVEPALAGLTAASGLEHPELACLLQQLRQKGRSIMGMDMGGQD
jgi:hypothetical protein